MLNILFGLLLVAVLIPLVSTFPSIAIIYLIADSWFVGKIAGSNDLEILSKLNYLIAGVYFIVILGRLVLGRMRISSKLLTSPYSLMTILFLTYLCLSNYLTFHEIHVRTVAHAIFFLLMLLFFSSSAFVSRIRILIFVAVGVAIVLIVGGYLTSGNIFAELDDGGRIQPGFHVLLAIPFLYIGLMTARTQIKFAALSALFLLFILFIITRFSRSLLAILLLVLCYYFLSNRNRPLWRWGFLTVFVASSPLLISSNFAERLNFGFLISSGVNLKDDAIIAYTSGRSAFYLYAWNNFLDHPIFGAGYNIFSQTYSFTKTHALHSAWLQVLSETGVIGISLYLGIFIMTWMNHRVVCVRFANDRLRVLASEAALVGMTCFLLGGVVDNFGFDYRIFYIFVALSLASTIAPYQDTKSDYH